MSGMTAMQRPLLILWVILICTGLTAQSDAPVSSPSDEPAWLLMERGEEAFNRGELGDALRIFRSVLARNEIAPEPHYWIGRVFEEEGELELAEKEYQRALDYKRQLYLLEDELIIRERLARLYKIRGEYGAFEKALLAIIALDEEFDSPAGVAQQSAMIRLVSNQGLAKVVELYRIDASESYLAHAELGLFYYRTGRYRDSVLHLLYAGLTLLSRTIEYQRQEDPFYEYESLAGLLERALSDRENGAYLTQNRAGALFYYLGAALYASGASGTWEEVLNLVRDTFDGSPWRSRAIAQLADPYIEPVITAEEFFYFF